MNEDEKKPPRIDEHEVHSVFGLLREHVVDAAHGFQERVEDRLAHLHRPRETDPGLLRLGLSALLQTTNFVLEAFSGPTEHHGDPDDPDDHSP